MDYNVKYIPQDYYDADDALQRTEDDWEKGIVPRAALAESEAKLAEVIAYLRANGTMPITRHEILEAKLDELHPEAASREIVEYQGGRYRRQFKPLKRGKGGGVVTWKKSWMRLQ